jgi:septal ring factor EnvC (AmiA/AmiB activator)
MMSRFSHVAPGSGRPAPRGRRSAAGLGVVLLAALGAPAAARANPQAPSAIAPDGSGTGAEQQRSAEEARLARIHAEIDDLRDRLLGLEKRSGSVIDILDEIDMKIALLNRETEALEAEQRAALRVEESARREEEEIRTRLEASERAVRRWLLEVYKTGPLRYLNLVASSASPVEVAASQRVFERLSLEEGRRLALLQADRQRFDQVMMELMHTSRELDRLGDRLERRQHELQEARREKVALLSDIRAQQESQETALRELVQVESAIRELLGTLSGPGALDVAPSRGFDRFRGLLVWPVAGRLLVPFGNVRHPRFSTEVPHPGVDIGVAPGGEVRAVFDGIVVFSSWFRGYGQMIVIDHGDGYLSIYGQLNERLAEVGDEVRQADRIGRSGQGGTLGTPAVYFELRHDGIPLDPVLWLRDAKVREHHNVSATRRGDARPKTDP